MRHKSNNKTRPLFTLSLEMTRLVNETRLLLVPCFNSDIYGTYIHTYTYIPYEVPLVRCGQVGKVSAALILLEIPSSADTHCEGQTDKIVKYKQTY